CAAVGTCSPGGRYTTVRSSAADTLAAKLPSPVYDTDRWCVPRGSTVKRERPFRITFPGTNVNTARPEESSVANAIVLLPSRRMTVPVGAPAPVNAGVTVTVSTSCRPTGAGLAEAVNVVVVLAGLTVSRSAADRLGAKSAEPLNTAVKVWPPAVWN